MDSFIVQDCFSVCAFNDKSFWWDAETASTHQNITEGTDAFQHANAVSNSPQVADEMKGQQQHLYPASAEMKERACMWVREEIVAKDGTDILPCYRDAVQLLQRRYHYNYIYLNCNSNSEFKNDNFLS